MRTRFAVSSRTKTLNRCSSRNQGMRWKTLRKTLLNPIKFTNFSLSQSQTVVQFGTVLSMISKYSTIWKDLWANCLLNFATKFIFDILCGSSHWCAIHAYSSLNIFETIEINKRHRASLRQVNTGKKRAKPGEEKCSNLLGVFLFKIIWTGFITVISYGYILMLLWFFQKVAVVNQHVAGKFHSGCFIHFYGARILLW